MLTIIRGLPGSGKTRQAKIEARRWDPAVHLEADMWMTTDDGLYRFNPARLRECHGKCFGAAIDAMREGLNVVVSNVFSRVPEMAPYVLLAQAAGSDCRILHMRARTLSAEDLAGRNEHGVPASTIVRVSRGWENMRKFPPWFPVETIIDEQ